MALRVLAAACAPRLSPLLGVPVRTQVRYISKQTWTSTWADPSKRRTGVIGLKCGMTSMWDEWGVLFPVTVVMLEQNQVVERKTLEKHGHTALKIGAGTRKLKHLTKPMIGVYKAAGVPPKRYLNEFRVSPDALLDQAATIDVRHFVPGQYVDVQGTTVGKGFQGVMKRWNFGGQAASHGVSKTHRHMGSTGASQDPGRVWPGKKMPGHMGNKTKTVQNVQVYKVDPEKQMLFLKGHVPGHKGNVLNITDAIKKRQDDVLPYPTFCPDTHSELPLVMHKGEKDPLMWEK